MGQNHNEVSEINPYYPTTRKLLKALINFMVNSACYLLLTENLYFVTPSIIGCHENYFNSIIAEAGSEGRSKLTKLTKLIAKKRRDYRGRCSFQLH